jgi:hypothetical protein
MITDIAVERTIYELVLFDSAQPIERATDNRRSEMIARAGVILDIDDSVGKGNL